MTVSLYNSTGQLVAMTATDQYGNYQFTWLAAGTYTVVQTAPPGDNFETPGSVTLTVAAGTTTTVNFADAQGGPGF